MSNKCSMSQKSMRYRIHSSVTQTLQDDPDYISMQQKCKSENNNDNATYISLSSALNSAKPVKTYSSSQYNSIRESGKSKVIKANIGILGIRDSGQFKLTRQASSKSGPTVDLIRDHLEYQTQVSAKNRRTSSVGNLV